MLNAHGMTLDIFLALSIFLFTTILFVINAIRVDVVAVLVIVLLGLCNILPPEELFAGFSSEAVISLIAIMIMSAGLENTGISVKFARFMLRLGGDHPRRILFIVMVISGLASSVMRSIGTASLFLPIINRIHSRTQIDRSYLLMPMAFCSILGGMITMVGTSPLILLNGLLRHSSTPCTPFGLFEVTPIGLLLLASGIIYFLIINYKRSWMKKSTQSSSSTSKEYFNKYYGKEGELFELQVLPESDFEGVTVSQIELKLANSMSLVAVSHKGEDAFPPLRNTIVKAGTSLAILATALTIREFAANHKLRLLPALNIFQESLHAMRAGFCEAVIPPSSHFISHEVREMHMRRNHGLHVLALRRGNTVYQGEELGSIVLRSGDTLGMYSNWLALSKFESNPDFFVLTNTYPTERAATKKTPQAIFFMLLAFILSITGIFHISICLLFGAMGMIATRVLTIDEAYSKVSWQTVFLMAGLIPLGTAIDKTGTASWIVEQLLPHKITYSIFWVEVILAISATLLALVVSNIGATVILVPVALGLAVSLNADPRLFALTVALGASNTFMIPTHQVNSLIAGAGSYSMRNFLLIGGGMTLIYWVVMIGGLQLL
jgi:di/tricarboxylate transporter